MSAVPREVRLHAKLYRARAVSDAVASVAASFEGTLSRRRAGQYHVVAAEGAGDAAALSALAAVANAALVLTIEAEET